MHKHNVLCAGLCHMAGQRDSTYLPSLADPFMPWFTGSTGCGMLVPPLSQPINIIVNQSVLEFSILVQAYHARGMSAVNATPPLQPAHTPLCSPPPHHTLSRIMHAPSSTRTQRLSCPVLSIRYFLTSEVVQEILKSVFNCCCSVQLQLACTALCLCQ
jgi:hypothetical protein